MSTSSRFQPGELASRIAIEHEVTTPDDLGGNTSQWMTLFECWASVKSLSAQRIYPGQSETAEISHEILIRHDLRLKPHMRLRFKERVFDIVSVVDPDETGRFLKISALEAT